MSLDTNGVVSPRGEGGLFTPHRWLGFGLPGWSRALGEVMAAADDGEGMNSRQGSLPPYGLRAPGWQPLLTARSSTALTLRGRVWHDKLLDLIGGARPASRWFCQCLREKGARNHTAALAGTPTIVSGLPGVACALECKSFVSIKNQTG